MLQLLSSFSTEPGGNFPNIESWMILFNTTCYVELTMFSFKGPSSIQFFLLTSIQTYVVSTMDGSHAHDEL